MADPDDWWAQYQRKEAERLKHSEEMAEYLMGALRFLGVQRVPVAFAGYGDDGDVEDPVYEPTPRRGLAEGPDYVLRQCCSGQLPGGWEINAGSTGSVVIDVAAGKCEVNVEWHEDEDEEFDEAELEDED